MLKSQVSVALCAVLLCVAGSAVAGSAFSGSPVAGSALAPVSTSAFAVSQAHYAVSFALPGRQMKKFVASYIRENDEELGMVRERSLRPFLIIDSVMESYDLPVELRYLAVIESELRATALSRVGARGPWQLMAVTARELGLKVNRRSDERINYYKSTRAAALYLRDLHREYKDWLLVLAAYNAGPVPVNRAIRLAHSRNFWVLERYLPAETRQHVKRFIATAYYFMTSDPVEDLAPVAPSGLQSGPQGLWAGGHDLPGRNGVTGSVPGDGAMGLAPATGFAAGYHISQDLAVVRGGIISAVLGRKEVVGIVAARKGEVLV